MKKLLCSSLIIVILLCGCEGSHEHLWNEWYPSNDEDYMERNCAYCDKIQTRRKTEADTTEAPSTECDHEYGKWKTTKKPTCTEDGERVKICSKCGSSYSEIIDLIGHKWGSWKIKKTATYAKDGTKRRTCKNCGEVNTKKYSLPITMGMKNALKQANNYLDYTAFSESGLIEQLKYEGYTNDEAEYAVSRCGADWKEQAAIKAQDYLDTMSFSRNGLIEQLEYEGFTYEQAVYGVEKVGY